MKEDEEVLRKVHHALMEVHLLEGELVCPETGRKFPVRQGVPNMLLHEDGAYYLQYLYHSCWIFSSKISICRKYRTNDIR